MKNIKKLTIFFAFIFCINNIIIAQATRTWVSGLGDDANPCSRTAPCKTFAGAISKTAAGGEINAIDPGGFGAVTITKSITIACMGVECGILVSGTNGIIINAAATDVIILKGLDLEGLGTSLSGVNILSAKSVYIEDCTINNFTNGVNVAPPTNNVNVIVQNSRLTRNFEFGVLAIPTGTVSANVNLNGILIGMGGTGITAAGTNAIVNVSNSSILNNITSVGSSTGKIFSFGNNIITGNSNNNAFLVKSPQ